MSFKQLIYLIVTITTLNTINIISTQIKISAEQPQQTQIKARDWFDRGVIKANTKDYQGAISDFTKAIEINPRHAQAYYQRGLIYAKYALGEILNPDGTLPGCVRVNEYSISCKVDITANWKNLNQQQAIADFNRAIEIIPQYAAAYHQRGLIQENQPDKLNDFQTAIDIYHSNALSYLNQNNYSEAAKLLEQVEQLYVDTKKVTTPSSSKSEETEDPLGSSESSPDMQKSPHQLMNEAREALRKSDLQTAVRKYKLAARIFKERKDSKRYKEVQQIITGIEQRAKR